MKKLAALFLALIMLFALAACGQTPAPTDAPVQTAAPSATTAPTDAPTPAPHDGDPVGIRMFMRHRGPSPDQEKVLAKVNEITLAKSNVYLAALDTVSSSAMTEQINLIMASQEGYDILMDGIMRNLAGHLNKGYLSPIDDELEAYGQDILEVLGDYSSAVTYNGEIMGITTRRDLATGAGIQIRKDLADQYDFDLESVKTAADVEAFFPTVMADNPDMTMIHYLSFFSPTGFGVNCWMDPEIYRSDYMASRDGVAIYNATQNDQFSILAELDEYEAACVEARRWYEAGYMPSDLGSDAGQGQELMKAGRLFAMFNSMKAGEAGQTLTLTDREVVDCMIVPPYADTFTSIAFIWVFPIFSDNETEYAIKWINELYGDADVVNLMCYGIEGEHYVQLPDGHVNYPEGITSDNCGWALRMNWMMGDQFKSKIWVGTDLTVWEDQDAMNKEATRSAAMGLIFDQENVKTVMASVSNVHAEYKVAVECGMVDPVAMLPEYISKLKTAGIEQILTEKQAQLDAALGA
ncbi:DUF3502 domain-containing protein [Oscillospiraceae bacterium OttesenSCG-928-F05]|nr:DUF3502 domain-containing protein [Oscillospiraceae bacterium OttesenSCG-928-F05]